MSAPLWYTHLLNNDATVLKAAIEGYSWFEILTMCPDDWMACSDAGWDLLLETLETSANQTRHHSFYHLHLFSEMLMHNAALWILESDRIAVWSRYGEAIVRATHKMDEPINWVSALFLERLSQMETIPPIWVDWWCILISHPRASYHLFNVSLSDHMLPQYYSLYCEVTLRLPDVANEHVHLTRWISHLDASCFESERYRPVGLLIGRVEPSTEDEKNILQMLEGVSVDWRNSRLFTVSAPVEEMVVFYS